MTDRVRRAIAVITIILLMLLPVREARADTIKNAAIAAIVGIVVVTAVITTAVVLTLKHHPSVTGCVAQGANGLQLLNEGDRTSFMLAGDTIGVKAGERVKLSGRKNGKDAMGSRHFQVEKLKRDYGPCQPATP